MDDVGDVENDPAGQARAEFAEGLDVDRLRCFADERNWKGDSWVEFSANEEIVQDIAGVSASGEFAFFGVGLAGLGNREAGDVDVDRKEDDDKQVCRDDLEMIVPDKAPDREVDAIDEGSSKQGTESDEGRGEC